MFTLRFIQRGKVAAEAFEQIRFGDQHIDRETDAKAIVQLHQPLTQCQRLITQRLGRLRQQIGNAQRDDDAVDRLTSAIFTQQVEKMMPFAGITLLLTLLGTVAPGGIEQHRIIGEPPVAVAGAANAAQRRLAEFICQRKLQARVDQRGGFTGTGRADNHVPRQLIEILTAKALCPERRALAAVALEVRLFQHVSGFGETPCQHLLFTGQALTIGFWRVAFAGFKARHQLAIEPDVVKPRNRLP